jgi:hypothetical protein
MMDGLGTYEEEKDWQGAGVLREVGGHFDV